MSLLTRLQERLSRRLSDVWSVVVAPASEPEADHEIAEQARSMAPVVWLIGKVQSGKSSIVRALTGCAEAEVGSGFKACTRTARAFDFPDAAPVIRFLDTRGLGEVGYDPAEDIAACEGSARIILPVMKALDHDQGAVIDVIRAVRRRHPDWPILVSQTSLHEGYPPGADHPKAYPFGIDGLPLHANALPPALARSIAAQRRMFDGLPGRGPLRFVPIDFTKEGDGYEPLTFGLDAMIGALRDIAPRGLVSSLEAADRSLDARARRAHPHIVGYAAAAAAADVVPVAGLVAVPGVQAKMLHSLARIYAVTWDRRTVGEFAAALGAGTALKALTGFGARELGKLVPVYGQTAGSAAAAAASFAMTFALGKAACVFLNRRRRGRVEAGAVAEAYRAALQEAFRLSAERQGPSGGERAAS